MRRYIYFGIAILIGLIAGMYYGWVVSPVEVAESGPAILRDDYRADYALMVAEIFQSEQNPEKAIGRLDFLEIENPLESIDQALHFGAENGFRRVDLEMLESLDEAIRLWDPRLEETATP